MHTENVIVPPSARWLSKIIIAGFVFLLGMVVIRSWIDSHDISDVLIMTSGFAFFAGIPLGVFASHMGLSFELNRKEIILIGMFSGAKSYCWPDVKRVIYRRGRGNLRIVQLKILNKKVEFSSMRSNFWEAAKLIEKSTIELGIEQKFPFFGKRENWWI